jgi:uncharacterized protein (TIRG00374 family)
VKLRHWLGLVISALCLWWALRGVSWGEVGQATRGARLVFLVAVAVGSIVVGVFVRALRWRIFCPPVHSLRNADLVTATGVGLMANNILPARIGEFVRAYVLGRRTPIPMTTAFGSLFVERLFDAGAILLILAAAVSLSSVPEWMVVLARVSTGVFVVLLILEIFVVAMPRQLLRLGRAVAARVLPRRWEPGVEGTLERFIEGFQLLRDPRRILLALVSTFVFWGLNGLLFYLGFLAFDLQRIGLDGALIVQSVMALGISIPSSPGYVGTYQASVVQALSAFDVERDIAFSYSLVFHAAQYLPVTLFGLFLAWRANLSWREIERSEEEVEEVLTEEAAEVVPEARIS